MKKPRTLVAALALTLTALALTGCSTMPKEQTLSGTAYYCSEPTAVVSVNDTALPCDGVEKYVLLAEGAIFTCYPESVSVICRPAA